MSEVVPAHFWVTPRPATVRKQAEAQLRRAITEGHFRPGDHLSDRALQELLQVSRTVVREAVRQLEAEGLVETFPHRGSFVKIIKPAEAKQIYEVRVVLEELAAREFTKNATEDQIDQLENVLDQIRVKAKTPVGHELIALKQKFYDILLAGCGNKYVGQMLSQILNQNSQLRATTMSNPTRLPAMVGELEKILGAVRKRDAEAASSAIAQHVRNAASAALSMLEKAS